MDKKKENRIEVKGDNKIIIEELKDGKEENVIVSVGNNNVIIQKDGNSKIIIDGKEF